MEKIIIIKYGELSTKKDNIGFFLKCLKNNIIKVLQGINFVINYDYGRMYIKTDDFDYVLNKLNKIFGIQGIMIGYLIESDNIDQLSDYIVTMLKEKKFSTFKVETKRSNKNYPLTSVELSAILGENILKSIPQIKVDVHNPELLVNVELRLKETLIYFNEIKGLGGYPVGTQGKALLMLSGGIDSPVAGYLALKRGVSLETVYFESPPHTSQKAKAKVIRLAEILKAYNPEIGIYIINFTEIQEAILKNIPNDYLITIMRRMMYRISEAIALKNKYHAIITGESIGQVASQTLTSMASINEVVKIPVIRPVVCLDKLEIIALAQKIKTYDISIEPFEDCCTIFVPKHPVINPCIFKCEDYEKLLDWENLIKKALENSEYIKLKDIKSEYDFL